MNENKYCRLCLGTKSLCEIFTNDDYNLLPIKAMVCLDIKIQEDDGLPMMCLNCVNCLNQFYTFRQISRTIHKQLQKDTPLGQIGTFKSKRLELVSENFDIKPDLNEITCCESDLHYVSPPKVNMFDASNSDHFNTCNDFQTNNTKIKKITKKLNCLNTSKDKKSSFVQCDICGKIFKHKTILKKHILSHLGIKRYSCKLCNKKFTRAEHVIVHTRAHNGIRPFVCEVCARGFTKKQDLLRHMRVHSDEKNYSCPQCERRFKRSGDVRSHLRSHTGDRPYSCANCRKTYSSHSGLKKHNRTNCPGIQGLRKPSFQSLQGQI